MWRACGLIRPRLSWSNAWDEVTPGFSDTCCCVRSHVLSVWRSHAEHISNRVVAQTRNGFFKGRQCRSKPFEMRAYVKAENPAKHSKHHISGHRKLAQLPEGCVLGLWTRHKVTQGQRAVIFLVHRKHGDYWESSKDHGRVSAMRYTEFWPKMGMMATVKCLWMFCGD